MPLNTFFGLNIGVSGMNVYNAAVVVTGHNIANAEAEGYCRQILGKEAGHALSVGMSYGMVGSGVIATGIGQNRDFYYDTKYWNTSARYGMYNSKSHYMTSLETYFNEFSNEGFTVAYNMLNNSLEELAKDLKSGPARTQVTNYAKNFTEYINSMQKQLTSLQEETNTEIKNCVDRINALSQQIASLTKQINTVETNGGVANDLRDQRALLVDELSKLANVTVEEKIVGVQGVGSTSYVVRLDGEVLVNSYDYKTLKLKPRESKNNMNDSEGLYDIIWSNGQKFNMDSYSLSGSLRALLEIRDGNNEENLKGVAEEGSEGESQFTMTGATINDINKLNIPQKGKVMIGSREYNYTGFTVDIDEDTGAYKYTFDLEEPLSADAAGENVTFGRSVDFKGIPYYMAQMNQFVRTFSRNFNELHKQGEDLNGDAGLDFFNGTDAVTGENFAFSDISQTHMFSSTDDSYYRLTAENFTITKAIYDSPEKIAASGKITNGVEEKTILDALKELKDNNDMFKQGTPSAFLQTLVADVGVDTKKVDNFAENQKNILDLVDKQRMSISGVDTDEESMNLVKYQTALELSMKLISIMDQIYNKLINEMGA